MKHTPSPPPPARTCWRAQPWSCRRRAAPPHVTIMAWPGRGARGLEAGGAGCAALPAAAAARAPARPGYSALGRPQRRAPRPFAAPWLLSARPPPSGPDPAGLRLGSACPGSRPLRPHAGHSAPLRASARTLCAAPRAAASPQSAAAPPRPALARPRRASCRRRPSGSSAPPPGVRGCRRVRAALDAGLWPQQRPIRGRWREPGTG